MITQKRCRDCKEIKPVAEFYKNRTMPDGYANNCKVCKYKFYQLPKNKKRQNAYVLKWVKENKYWDRPYVIKQKIARRVVAKALKEKTLFKKLCAVCDSKEVEAHHYDYEKPLNVIWLCLKHHAEIHTRLRREKKELLKGAE